MDNCKPLDSGSGSIGAREARHHRRVGTGCITCKIRRIKCDEGKPACNRCLGTGRTCDGYVLTPTTQGQLERARERRQRQRQRPPLLLAGGGSGSWSDSIRLCLPPSPKCSGIQNEFEDLGFSFYLSRTTPRTNVFVQTDFWDRLVLQLCHEEPAIKHAVLALSALHRRWESTYRTFAQVDETALVQYGQAVAYTKKLMVYGSSQGSVDTNHNSNNDMTGISDRETVHKILVACVLFICFENLVANYRSAQMHLRNGMSILSGYRDRTLQGQGQGQGPRRGWSVSSSTAGRGVAEDEIVHLMSRFDFQAMTFSDDASPYRYELADLDGRRVAPMPTEAFSSLAESRRHLFDLLRYIFRSWELLHADDRHGGRKLTALTEECIALLVKWTGLFDALLATLTPETLGHQRHAISFLRIYQITASYILTAGFIGREMAFDDCMPLFVDILSLVEFMEQEGASSSPARSACNAAGISKNRKTFSLELGISAPLFFMAIKCRDPVIRRRVISVLRNTVRREGIWDSLGASMVAERVMRIEEELAGLVFNERDIEGGRFGEVKDYVDREWALRRVTEKMRIVEVHTKIESHRKQVRVKAMMRPNGIDAGWVAREEWVELLD